MTHKFTMIKQESNSKNNNEKIIVNHISIVTMGLTGNFQISNAYSIWKNTSKGLDFIKDDQNRFYQGVDLWLNITQNQLLGINNNDILAKLSKQYEWIENLLTIKKIYSVYCEQKLNIT